MKNDDPSNPLISIIIPAYNAAGHIAEAISSVARQTYKNLEIVVVNDGSTDDTLVRLNHLQAAEPRIKIIDQPNRGPGAARNTGIRAASGDYIAFLDSDDAWDPRKLKLQITSLANSGEKNALSMTAFTFCLLDGTMRPAPYAEQELTFKEVIQGGFTIMPSSWLVPRQIFMNRAVGLFDESMRCGEDADWILRAMHAGVKPVIENQALTLYTVSQPTKRYKGQSEGIAELIKRHGDWMRQAYASPATEDLLRTFGRISTHDVSISEEMGAFAARNALPQPQRLQTNTPGNNRNQAQLHYHQ
jgi:glycosyltransferase involved in cell wall biosynthesis